VTAAPGTDGADGRRRRHIWAAGLAGIVAVAIAAAAVLWPLDLAERKLQAANRHDAALQQLAQLRTSLSDFQLLLDPSLSAPRSVSALTDDLAKAAQLAQTVDAQARIVAGSLAANGLPEAADALRTANTAFAKAYTGLAPLATGLPLAKVMSQVTAERAGFAAMWDTTSTARGQLQSSREQLYRDGTSVMDIGRILLWAFSGLAVAMLLVGAGFLGQRAERRYRRERLNARRQSFANELSEALEMAGTELDVYAVARKGLRASVSRLRTQVLIADSSRAHLHEVLNTADDMAEWSGCSVPSPAACPATTRGHTLTFASSQALNACPYLQDRPTGDCSAACVPISITGKTIGVTHATGPDGVLPAAEDVRYLELTSRRSSDRIALLRAFAKSETQARTDPLTGLLNRRSLENAVRDLNADGVGYTVAYGDLDHFKTLNDTHGHQAGDQALRLFARVLREAIRPNDIAARYGGEEFVVVFPRTGDSAAARVLERIRERLALALIAGHVAPFTISFGVAASSPADTFDRVVAAADEALLAAKAAGRDRVVIASALTPATPQPDA
jgi:diguanylate cyclase (GGDEF)-like protein